MFGADFWGTFSLPVIGGDFLVLLGTFTLVISDLGEPSLCLELIFGEPSLCLGLVVIFLYYWEPSPWSFLIWESLPCAWS